MKNLKYLLLLLTILFTVSCETLNAEKEYNKRSWEIKKKQLELNYLKELNSYRDELSTKQKIKEIDSIVNTYRQIIEL